MWAGKAKVGIKSQCSVHHLRVDCGEGQQLRPLQRMDAPVSRLQCALLTLILTVLLVCGWIDCSCAAVLVLARLTTVTLRRQMVRSACWWSRSEGPPTALAWVVVLPALFHPAATRQTWTSMLCR
jgi:hypothetical protein